MNDGEHKREIEEEFDELIKKKFPDPDECTELQQTRTYIYELNQVIAHFERKFNYVPSSAHLLFDKYNKKQEKMLFDNYLREYGTKDKPTEDE